MPPTRSEALERARLLFRQMPSVALSGLLVPGFVLIWQWDHTPRLPMVLWAGWLASISVWRLHAWRRFWSEPERDQMDRMAQFTFSALLSATAWAVAAVAAFQSPDPTDRWVLLALLAGIGAGAAVSLSAHYPAFAAFFAPPMLAFATLSISQSTLRDAAVGTLVLVFTGMMMLFARNIHRTLTETIRMRVANEALIEQQLAQQAELQRALTARKRFLATVSHDLRQPVQAFSLLLQGMAEAGTAPEPAAIRRVAQSALRLRDLVSNLLDDARLDMDRAEPRLEWLDPMPVLEAVHAACLWEAEHRGIALRVVPARVRIRTDARFLQRILQNLVENAVHHSGGSRVVVGFKRRGGQLELRVLDDGDGIPAVRRPLLFRSPDDDPPDAAAGTAAAASTTGPRVHGGLGLGLPVSHALAGRAGHALHLLDRVRGCGFALSLARWRRSGEGDGAMSPAQVTPAVPRPHAEPAGYGAAANASPATVLLLDDEPLIVDALSAALVARGFEVVSATRSRDALLSLLAGGARPDVIVTDWRLGEAEPAGSGIRSLQTALGRRTPVVVVTAWPDDETLRSPELRSELVISRVLTKPVLVPVLIDAINATRAADPPTGRTATPASREPGC